MRKLMFAAIFALSAAFAAPAFANTATCDALDAEIQAAATDVGAFFDGLLSVEDKSAVNQAMATIITNAQANNLSDPSQLPDDARTVFDAVESVMVAASAYNEAFTQAMYASYSLRVQGCTDEDLRRIAQDGIAVLKDPAIRANISAAMQDLVAKATSYNDANSG